MCAVTHRFGTTSKESCLRWSLGTTSGWRQVTPWTRLQLITGPHRDKQTSALTHTQNMQTQGLGIEPSTFLLWGSWTLVLGCGRSSEAVPWLIFSQPHMRRKKCLENMLWSSWCLLSSDLTADPADPPPVFFHVSAGSGAADVRRAGYGSLSDTPSIISVPPSLSPPLAAIPFPPLFLSSRCLRTISAKDLQKSCTWCWVWHLLAKQNHHAVLCTLNNHNMASYRQNEPAPFVSIFTAWVNYSFM